MPLNPVKLDKNLIVDYLNRKEWQPLITYLREKFVVTRNDITRQPNPILITQSTVDTLSYILKDLTANKFQNLTADVLTVTTEVFRSLRNSAAFSSEVQTMIIKDTEVLQYTFDIFQELLKSSGNSRKECVKIILQFLINVVANNSENTTAVWKIFEGIIVRLFREPEYSYYASALLYNIVYVNRSLIQDCSQLYSSVLEGVASCSPNEYHTFLLEIFVQDGNFMNTYERFEIAHRITLLLALADFVTNKDDDFSLSFDIVQQLAVIFKSKSNCILKTVTSYVDNVEPQEVVLLLEILASLSSEDGYSKELQDDKDLITTCAFLLKNIHTLGKESQNHFTPIQKLSEAAATNSETRKNPVFGFKADLIRLLGNACWKNKENQDKLRELECIPLLLDCCNIDARNPFIIQWTILAVRNLCENNLPNQTVIVGMSKQGVVNSATLQEMGLTLHDDGTNKIVIGPLPDRN